MHGNLIVKNASCSIRGDPAIAYIYISPQTKELVHAPSRSSSTSVAPCSQAQNAQNGGYWCPSLLMQPEKVSFVAAFAFSPGSSGPAPHCPPIHWLMALCLIYSVFAECCWQVTASSQLYAIVYGTDLPQVGWTERLGASKTLWIGPCKYLLSTWLFSWKHRLIL